MVLGSLGTVSYDIVAKDQTATGVDSATLRADKIRKAGLAVGGVMTGMGVAMMVAGDQINEAYRDIQVGTGATGEALEDLKDDFHAIYGAIPADAAAVSGALSSLNTLTGATGDTLQELTTNVLELSRLLGEDGTNNAEAFGQALAQFGISAEDGVGSMDALYKVTQESGMGFGELSRELTAYGSVLLNANFSMEESADLFGRLHANGISVSRIMPGLNAAFRKWAAEGKNSRTELDRVVKSIQNAETETKALAIATDTFGAEGAQRLTVAIKNGAFALDDLGDSLKDTDGLIQQSAKGTLTLSEKFGLLKTKVTETLAPFGTLGAVFSGLGPMIIGATSFYSIFTAAQSAAAASGTTLAASIKLTTLAFLTSPIGLIIIAVVALGVALYVLEKKFGLVTKAIKILSDIARKVIAFFGKLKDKILGVKDVTDDLTDATNELGEAEAEVKRIEEELTDTRKTEEDATHDVEDAAWKLEEAQLAVAATAEEIDELTTAYEDLLQIEKDVLDITEDIDDQHRAVEHAMWNLKDAQDNYNDAVAEYGEHSDEAAKANLRLRDAQDRYDDSLKRVEGSEQKLIDKNNEKTDVLKENNATSLQDLEDTLDAKQEAAEPAFENIRDLELDLEGKVEIQKQREADVTHLEGALDEKKKDIEDYTDEVERIEEESGKTRLNVAERLYGGIRELADVAYSKVLSILDRFGDKLLFLLGPIGAVIYAFRNWREILDIVKEKLNSVISYLGGLYDKFKNLGKNLIEYLVNGIKEKIGNIKSTIENKFNEVISYIRNLYTTFKDRGKDLIDNLISGIKEKIEDVKKAFGDALDSAISHIKTFYRTFKDKGGELIDKLKDGANEKREELKNAISNVLNSAVNHISTFHRTFKDKGGELIDKLKDGANEKREELKNAISNVLNSAVNHISTFHRTFKDKGKELIDKLKDGANEKREELKTTISNILNSAVGNIGSWYNTFYGIGKNFVVGLINGITEKLGGLKWTFWTQLNLAIDYIRGWYTTFYGVGRNFIISLANGVVEKFWNLRDQIGIQLNLAVDYIKRWYDTFYNIGKALIQRMINGIIQKFWDLKDELNKILWWIYERLPHSPVKKGPLVEEPDWESYLIKPMRTAKISPSVMFESGIGGGAGISRPAIEINVEATIYNYSDVEEFERMIAEATAKGIHDAYGMR